MRWHSLTAFTLLTSLSCSDDAVDGEFADDSLLNDLVGSDDSALGTADDTGLVPQGEEPSGDGNGADSLGIQTGDNGGITNGSAGASAATGGATGSNTPPITGSAGTTSASGGASNGAAGAGSTGGLASGGANSGGASGLGDGGAPNGDFDTQCEATDNYPFSAALNGSWQGTLPESEMPPISGSAPGQAASLTLSLQTEPVGPRPECAFEARSSITLRHGDIVLVDVDAELLVSNKNTGTVQVLAPISALVTPSLAPAIDHIAVTQGDAACVESFSEQNAQRRAPPPLETADAGAGGGATADTTGDPTTSAPTDDAAGGEPTSCTLVSHSTTPTEPAEAGLYLYVVLTGATENAVLQLSWQRFECGSWQGPSPLACIDLTLTD